MQRAACGWRRELREMNWHQHGVTAVSVNDAQKVGSCAVMLEARLWFAGDAVLKMV